MIKDDLHFNSRPHEEVDLSEFLQPVLGYFYFNSRPHEEVDRVHQVYRLRGVHFNSRPHEEVDSAFDSEGKFIGLFQLTTSRRGRQKPMGKAQRNGVFQLTTSRRGRQGVKERLEERGIISTHDLTKRSTRARTTMTT